jgi:hypothetical protein
MRRCRNEAEHLRSEGMRCVHTRSARIGGTPAFGAGPIPSTSQRLAKATSELVQLDTYPELHQPRDRHIYLVWTSLNTSLKRGVGWKPVAIPCLWNYQVDSDPLLAPRHFSSWRGSGRYIPIWTRDRVLAGRALGESNQGTCLVYA